MSRRRLAIFIGIPVLFAAAWFRPYVPVPYRSLCAVKHMLGVNCPGCGVTRSFVALMHGGLRQSIDLNPIGLILALGMVYVWFRNLVSDGPLFPPKSTGIAVFFAVAGLFVQWFFYLFFELKSLLM